MGYGLFHWFGYPLGSEERFRLIRDAGFTSVMLWWGDEYAQMDGKKELQPTAARAHGLAVDNIHTSYTNCNAIWTEGPEGDAVLERTLSSIDDCARFGIPTAVVHLTEGDSPPPPCALGLARLARLAERAEKRGVDVALENLRKPLYLDYVFSGVDSPRLRFCFDSGHENCRCRGADLLAKHGARLSALHLHDNDGTADQHRIPGEGTVDWGRVRQRLATLGYGGSIAFEVTNEFSPLYKDAAAEDFLRAAYRKAVELFG